MQQKENQLLESIKKTSNELKKQINQLEDLGYNVSYQYELKGKLHGITYTKSNTIDLRT